MQKCPDCHATVVDEAIFCDQCGYQLRPKPGQAPPINSPQADLPLPEPVALQPTSTAVGSACPGCGYINLPGEAFCANCGTQLKQQEGPPAEPQKSPIPSSQAAAHVQPAPAQPRTCPTCGAVNPPEESYCKSCGFWLAGQISEFPPTKAASPADLPVNQSLTPPTLPVAGPSAFETVSIMRSAGRLHSIATNANLPLPPQPEIIIGRRDPDRGIAPDIDLSGQGTASNSVSRQHARLLVQGNQVYVEDLDSTNSSFLNRQRLQPGQRYLLKNGDELRLGGVIVVFYTK